MRWVYFRAMGNESREARDGNIGMTVDIYAFHDSCGTCTTKMCYCWRMVLKNKTTESASACA